jgi:hypothetical protein
MNRWRDIVKELDTRFLRYAIYCLIFAGIIEVIKRPEITANFPVIPSTRPTFEYGFENASRIPWETIDRAAAVVGLLLAVVQVVQWTWQIAAIMAKSKKHKRQGDFES